MVCCKVPRSMRVTLMRYFNYISDIVTRCYKIVMLTIAPIMFVTANILITIVTIMFLFIFLPPLFEVSVVSYLLNLIFGLWVLLNIVSNYFLCCLTHPGSPSYCSNPEKILGQRFIVVNNKKITQKTFKKLIVPGVSYSYCNKCHCIKPPRAHHCSVIERCAYGMDHYCPWMWNCVGQNNYRYFVLFLVYMIVGASWVIWFILSDWRGIQKITSHYLEEISYFEDSPLESIIFNLPIVAIVFSLATSAAASTGLLLSWHVYLIWTNQTTIEFYINMKNNHDAQTHGYLYKNPYDEGWRRNLRRVFGDAPWYHQLLPNTASPVAPLYPIEYRSDLILQQREAYRRNVYGGDVEAMNSIEFDSSTPSKDKKNRDNYSEIDTNNEISSSSSGAAIAKTVGSTQHRHVGAAIV